MPFMAQAQTVSAERKMLDYGVFVSTSGRRIGKPAVRPSPSVVAAASQAAGSFVSVKPKPAPVQATPVAPKADPAPQTQQQPQSQSAPQPQQASKASVIQQEKPPVNDGKTETTAAIEKIVRQQDGFVLDESAVAEAALGDFELDDDVAEPITRQDEMRAMLEADRKSLLQEKKAIKLIQKAEAKEKRKKAREGKILNPIGFKMMAIISILLLIAVGGVTYVVSYFMTNDIKIINTKLKELGCRSIVSTDYRFNPNLAQSVCGKMVEIHCTFSLLIAKNLMLINYYSGAGSPYIIYLQELIQQTSAIAATSDVVQKLNFISSEEGEKLCSNWNPLPMAIINKSTDMVKALLDAGANPNIWSSYGYTPLMLAVSSGKREIV